MKILRRIVVSGFVFVVAGLSPVGAVGASTGRSVRLRGAGTSTAIVNLSTGTGTADGTAWLSVLGKNRAHTDLTGFVLTGNTFVDTGTGSFVAANGDKVFTTVASTGTVTSTGSVTTSVNTIMGGTGRFAAARGTFTITSVGVTVSIVGSIVTSSSTDTVLGTISY
jgi:hypothetical protein